MLLYSTSHQKDSVMRESALFTKYFKLQGRFIGFTTRHDPWMDYTLVTSFYTLEKVN